jgi:hypothetical protein
MKEMAIPVTSSGIGMPPDEHKPWIEPVSEEADALLEKMNNIDMEADLAHQQWSEAEQAKAAARRSLYAEQNLARAQRVHVRAVSEGTARAAKRAALKADSRDVATKVKPGNVHFSGAQTSANVRPPTAPIVPNDAAAAQAQSSLKAQGSNIHVANISRGTAGSFVGAPPPKRGSYQKPTVEDEIINPYLYARIDSPRPPTVSHAGRTPPQTYATILKNGSHSQSGQEVLPDGSIIDHDAPPFHFSELGSRLDLSTGSGSNEVCANPVDANVLIPAFEAVEASSSAENSSGAQ